jgi:hypothetical protein
MSTVRHSEDGTMDRFSKTCLLLIVLLLSVIAIRPYVNPEPAHAASYRQVAWYLTGTVSEKHLNDATNYFEKNGCDVTAAVPITNTLKTYLGAGTPTGATGTENIVILGNCAASTKPSTENKK